jgi:hypothetical protein
LVNGVTQQYQNNLLYLVMLEKTFCMLTHEDELSNYMTTQKLSDKKDNQSDILCL